MNPCNPANPCSPVNMMLMNQMLNSNRSMSIYDLLIILGVSIIFAIILFKSSK